MIVYHTIFVGVWTTNAPVPLFFLAVFPDSVGTKSSVLQKYTLYCCSSYSSMKMVLILMHMELFVLIT